MHRPHAVLKHNCSPSMVVHDLDVFRASLRPAETHAELIVHADAVLSFAIAFQGFQVVARRRAQERQRLRRIELRQFACRRVRNA